LYVIGLPHRRGVISIHPDQSLELVNLSQLCPAEFLRPHFQSGYLAGEFPPVQDYEPDEETKGPYNFSFRLVNKLRLRGLGTWHIPYGQDVLYPTESEPTLNLVEGVKDDISDAKEQLKTEMNAE